MQKDLINDCHIEYDTSVREAMMARITTIPPEVLGNVLKAAKARRKKDKDKEKK